MTLPVVHLTAWLPAHAGDATGVFVREHVRAAAAARYGVLVHVKWGDPAARWPFSIEELPDEPVAAARVRVAPGRMAPFWLLVGLARAVVSLSGWRRPDIIHSHTLRTTVPAALLGRLVRRPVVATEHWTALLPGASDLSERELDMARRAYERADVVLPVGPTLAAAIRELAPSARIEVVPNAVDTSTFRLEASHPRVGPPRFLVVGSLVPRKRFDLALHALAAVRLEHRDIELDVVGDGPESPELEALARQLDLGSSCTFHGRRSKQEIATMMRESVALIVSSESETFSVVAAEALCCGLPVITGRCGGPEHFVDPTSGIIVEPLGVDTLARAMVHVLDAPWDPQAISAKASARFGLEAITARLSTVYDQVAPR